MELILYLDNKLVSSELIVHKTFVRKTFHDLSSPERREQITSFSW